MHFHLLTFPTISQVFNMIDFTAQHNAALECVCVHAHATT
jgi:hypothetical protein